MADTDTSPAVMDARDYPHTKKGIFRRFKVLGRRRSISFKIKTICAVATLGILTLKGSTYLKAKFKIKVPEVYLFTKPMRSEANLTRPYKILCTAAANNVNPPSGSYRARCLNFKAWVDRCAPSVKIFLGLIPPMSANGTAVFNATLYVKGVPPLSRPDLGRKVVDVVDNFGLRGHHVPEEFEVIVQNIQHGDEVFPNHTKHVIEHIYNTYPADMLSDEPRDVPEVRESNELRVGVVCLYCSLPDITLGDVNFTMINEGEEGMRIEDWFLKFMPGWTQQRMDSVLNDPQLGVAMLYIEIFLSFDIMVVTPKDWYTKLRFGSIQRITSQMRAGVPVLIEAKGLAFERFVDKYNYTCVFSRSVGKYPKLDGALELMKSVEFRKGCQSQGLQIARDFSPNFLGKRLLGALGYQGGTVC